MNDEVNIRVELFDEEKYKKNIQEHDFSMKEKDGKGDNNGAN